jgi:hypothetical protein
MKRTTYEEAGLPVIPDGPWIYAGLQYCDAALTLLVTLRSRSSPWIVRIYVRTCDEQSYREVVAAPSEDFRAGWASEKAPLAFFSAHGPSADELVLYKCELPGHALDLLPRPRLEGEHASVWVSDLHGASSDGRHVLIAAAIRPPPADGYKIRYVLARMDVGTGELEILAELPAIFA